ncbi:hypothetical protein [Candidatus Palauibacter sp.]|uniref:hypothetical protein n=1 Tax=Candidatus Palauibacter sp. TaxID=3101350 RepID=UPI003B5A149D
MKDDPRAHDFDWISARKACSYGCEFGKLRITVDEYTKQFEKGDWKTTRRARDDARRPAFVVSQCEPGLPPDELSDAHVWFVLQKEGIQTYSSFNSNSPDTEATLTLNDEGECVYMVKGKPLLRWQFLRMTLEPLFFGQ